MASARCYTKSGSVEKYESECFSGNTNHYPNSFSSNMTGPDSNGNYSITYDGYDDGDSSNYDCYCETIYGDWRNGGGVKKTFYFKKNSNIHINVFIDVIGYPDYAGNLVFNCTVSSNNSGIATSILNNNTIILSYSVVNTDGPVGSYSVRVKYGDNLLSPGIRYDEGKRYYINVDTQSLQATVNPSSGTYGKYNWDTSVNVATN